VIARLAFSFALILSITAPSPSPAPFVTTAPVPSCAQISGRFACGIPLISQHIIVIVVLDSRVHIVGLQGSTDPRSHYADPFGIKLGDPVDRLTSLRGTPDASYDENDDLVIRYGSANGVN